MDTRNAHQPRNRWATGIRAATLVVVTATLAAVWYPTRHDAPGDATANAAPSAVGAPDMSSYLPDRFAAPDGPVEPLPAQF